MRIEVNEREMEIILAHLANSAIPWCMAKEKREVDSLRKKLERHK